MTSRNPTAGEVAVTSFSTSKGEVAAGRRNDWASFLLLAFVGLPVLMVGAIVVYGFVVWFLQIMVLGPPT
jgi:nitrate reductase NapE